MSKPLRRVTEAQLTALVNAVYDLRTARDQLHLGGSPRLADEVAKLVKRADGALCHAMRAHSEHAYREQGRTTNA